MGDKSSTGGRSRKSERTRYYTFIVYPESAPSDWRDQLDSYHVQWVASPLHDQDINADGSPKKAHWHIMLAFDSLKTVDQASEIAKCTRGTVAQPLQGSPRSLVRYFAHLDNPDKHQYRWEDIETHGGIDISEYKRTSTQSDMDILRAILQFVVDNDITEYEDLVVYSMHNEPDWFESLALHSTYFVNAFIKSRRHRREGERGDP